MKKQVWKNKLCYIGSNKEAKILFSTRIGWEQDRMFKDLEDIFKIPEKNIFRGWQVHGKKIVSIDNDTDYLKIRKEKLDGLITNLKNRALVTYHADCSPIYFYDPKLSVIGLAHSGWKGSFLNIAAEMISIFREKYKSNPKNIKVKIGPNICFKCYEIKEDVSEKIENKYNYKDIIIRESGKLYLDVEKLIEENLKKEGILSENISKSNLCTSCNNDVFFSYRKEKTKGRMLASIIIKE